MVVGGFRSFHVLVTTLPADCVELITDPRKVFDSFSVFVEPLSYQRIFHLVSVFYITAHLVKYYFRKTAPFDFGSTGDSPLLVAFEIPGVGFSPSLSN